MSRVTAVCRIAGMSTTVWPVARFTMNDRRARAAIILAGVLCLLVYSATIFLPHSDGHLIGSDGRSYFAILRSLVFDRDFDFANEYEYVGFAPKPLTATGRPENPFAIGTPILWLPFFGIAHLLSLALSSFGLEVATNGLGLVYEAAVCLATIVLGSAAFVIVYQVTRRLFEPWPVLIACLVMWGGTAAIHYIMAEPSMSHGLTLFSMSLFLLAWYPIPAERSTLSWFAVGLAAGLAALVRWQDGIILVLPLAELGWRLIKRRLSIGSALADVVVLMAAAAVIFTPQFVMWARLYGTPLTIPQGNDFFNWPDPKPLLTLFSTRHGLITWHPVIFFALLGLVPLWKRDRALALAIIFVFAGQLYLNSAVARWWADDSFGGRRFTSLIPLLTISLAAFLTALRTRVFLYRLVVALFGILIIWNLLGMVQFVLLYVSRSEALTIKELTIDRFLLPAQLLARFLN